MPLAGFGLQSTHVLGTTKKRESNPIWHMRTGPFLDHLAKVGITPESVTHVFCTHLHTDHVGWNTRMVEGKWLPTFPRAQYLFGKEEYNHWSRTPDETMADSVQPILDAGLAKFVDVHHVLVSSRNPDVQIYLRPTRGHTPGHCSVVIKSQGASALITGDCIHHPIQFTEMIVSPFDTDSEQALQTRKELLHEFCDTDTLIFGTHFAGPGVGVVRRYRKNYFLDTGCAAGHEAYRANL